MKKKELPRTNKKKFRIKKVIQRKFDNLCIKWKGFDNSFNSQVDKKGIIKNVLFS